MRKPPASQADTSGLLPANSVKELAESFNLHRERLQLMVRLRMDHRLQGRVDPSDVLQEAYIECARRFPEYQANPSMPRFLWMRFLVGQKLVDIHRQHLGAKMRDAAQEVSLNRGAYPQASSVSLAAQLLGHLTSPSYAAMRAELQMRVQSALNAMEPMDREILTLRHFEMLSNEETAQVLGLMKSTASNRYIRALRRLKGVLSSIANFPNGI
jgi:RNA polymerase sigma-70 factor, ECF subfamily